MYIYKIDVSCLSENQTSYIYIQTQNTMTKYIMYCINGLKWQNKRIYNDNVLKYGKSYVVF